MGPRRRRIAWSECAYEALDDALAYVAQDSPRAAERLLSRVLHAFESHSGRTERGRIAPELADPKIRELIVSPYGILYGHDQEYVRLLALVHDAQAVRLRRSDLRTP